MTDIGGLPTDGEIHLPVRERRGASEGENEELVRVVNCDVARIVRLEGILKFYSAMGSDFFDQRAITLWAGDWGAGDRCVVVSGAVGHPRVLSLQLKLMQQILGDTI